MNEKQRASRIETLILDVAEEKGVDLGSQENRNKLMPIAVRAIESELIIWTNAIGVSDCAADEEQPTLTGFDMMFGGGIFGGPK